MKVQITGNTAVVTTTISAEDFAKVKKLKPSLLTVLDEDKKPVFRADNTGTGSGSISKCGIEFVPGVNGALIVSFPVPAENEDKAKQYVFDKCAAAVAYMGKVEAAVSDNIDTIKADEAAFMEGIVVD